MRCTRPGRLIRQAAGHDPGRARVAAALPALPGARTAPLRAHRLSNYARDLHALVTLLRPAAASPTGARSTASTCALFAARSHAGGLAPRSIQRRLSAVRSFFELPAARGRRVALTAQSPRQSGRVRAPKAQQRLPHTLDADQMARLLEIPAGDALAARDHAHHGAAVFLGPAPGGAGRPRIWQPRSQGPTHGAGARQGQQDAHRAGRPQGR